MEKIKKEGKKVLVFLLCMVLYINQTVFATEPANFGVDENGNTWSYDEETKTLTFSGKKDIQENYSMDGHSPQPKWMRFEDSTEHLVIEKGITGIRKGDFESFTSLKTVEMADTVTHIDAMAFAWCWRMEQIKLSKRLKYIGGGGFYGCGFKEISLPVTLKKMGGSAFDCCENLEELSIPDSVTKMGSGIVGHDSKLKKIILPSKIKQIKDCDFRRCESLETIKIPKEVESVTMSAFGGCPMKEIILPKNVKEIKRGSTLGGKVFFEKPYYGYFNNDNLKTIIIQSKKIKKIAKGSFSGLRKNCVIKVPKSKKKQYTKMLRASGLSKKIKIRSK